MDMNELVCNLIVENEVRVDNEWRERKLGWKNDRLMKKYGRIINGFKDNVKVIDELGVRKGFGWDYWKMEIRGDKEVEDVVIDRKKLGKVLIERREDRIVDGSKVNLDRNVCMNCLDMICKRDWVDKNGWMRVGKCDKFFEIDMSLDGGEWRIEVDRNGMWREIRKNEILEIRERIKEYKEKWDSGEYLKEWRMKRGKRIEFLMDWRKVRKEMMKREVKDIGYEGVMKYRKMEFEKWNIFME